MVLSETSLFYSVAVGGDPLGRQVTSIDYDIEGPGGRGSIAFSRGAPPTSGADYDELEILRTIYNSAAGFRNSDGPISIGLGDFAAYYEDFDHWIQDYDNPFAQPAGESTVLSRGYGHYQVTVWQDVADTDGTPGLPNDDPQDGDDLRTAWGGGWSETRPTGTIADTDTRWRCDGHYTIDADGDFTDIQWIREATEQTEYSYDALTWSSVLDSIGAQRSRWERDRYPDGTWGPAQPLFNGDDGWTDVFGDIESYSGADGIASFRTVSGDFDLTHFHELQIVVRAFGDTEAGGDPSRWGAAGAVEFPRPAAGWTSKIAQDNTTIARGSYKVSLDDVLGLRAVQALSSDIDDEVGDNVYAVTDFPERRMSFGLHLYRAPNPNTNSNLVRAVRAGNFPNSWAKCITNVRFR